MSEDWRLRVNLEEPSHAEHVGPRLDARELEHDVAADLGDRIAVSRNDDELFMYASTEEAARAAERVVRQDLDEHGASATLQIDRWHDDAEEWRPADEPLPDTDAERAEERAELMEREDRDDDSGGYAGWEVWIDVPHRRDARALAERLESEGFEPVRRWRYVFVGAPDEDAAKQLADRLRPEVPEGSTLTVEGTFATVERNNPFAIFGAFTGEP